MLTRTPIVALLALCLLSASATAAPPSPPPPDARADSAVVELVEVGDMQCPFCARAHATVTALRAQYGDKLTFRWVHNPLPFHNRARPAAVAVEAARNQGKLDAMVAAIYAQPQMLEASDLRAAAEKIGLDLARFDKDLVDPATAAKVDLDQRLAVAVGATGTPCFFINGRELKGAQPMEKFTALVDDELGIAALVGKSGPDYRKARITDQNAKLYGYLHGGVVPPENVGPAKASVDKVVYKVEVDPAVDAILGPKDALFTLVYFGDYQCPFCRKLQPTLSELMAKHPDLRVVVKHLPLPFHEQARPAAMAAICAQAQKKFQAMHELLWAAEPEELGPELYRELAKKAELNLKAFDKCLVNPATEARIVRDEAAAHRSSARGTPNTFINGRKIVGAKTIDAFESIIDDERPRAEALKAKGVSLTKLYAELVADGKVFETLESQVNTFDVKNAPRLGDPKAKVQVAFFGDLQCPFSARAYRTLQSLVDAYGGLVSVTFHHFPLSFHVHARPAAELSVCAAEQGKFWELATWLFDNQKEIENLGGAADAAGLDRSRLGACLGSNRAATVVDQHVADAQAAGLRGTPTIYIQGRRFNSPSGYGLGAYIDAIETLLPKDLRGKAKLPSEPE